MARTVYIIEGPTAVGKTAVAIALAQRLGTGIISADSRQCYKEMTIGTAKPSPEELATVKHYFIDEFSVVSHITAAHYEDLALGYLEEIFKEQDTAVVCGGTGLYIKALCDGLDEMPQVNPDITQDVQTQYEAHGIAWLQQTIKEEDPEFKQYVKKIQRAFRTGIIYQVRTIFLKHVSGWVRLFSIMDLVSFFMALPLQIIFIIALLHLKLFYIYAAVYFFDTGHSQ